MIASLTRGARAINTRGSWALGMLLTGIFTLTILLGRQSLACTVVTNREGCEDHAITKKFAPTVALCYLIYYVRSGGRAAGDGVQNNSGGMEHTNSWRQPHSPRLEEKSLFSSQVAHSRTCKGEQMMSITTSPAVIAIGTVVASTRIQRR